MNLNIIEIENIIGTLNGCKNHVDGEILSNRINYSIDVLEKYKKHKFKKILCKWKDKPKHNKKLKKALSFNK